MFLMVDRKQVYLLFPQYFPSCPPDLIVTSSMHHVTNANFAELHMGNHPILWDQSASLGTEESLSVVGELPDCLSAVLEGRSAVVCFSVAVFRFEAKWPFCPVLADDAATGGAAGITSTGTLESACMGIIGYPGLKRRLSVWLPFPVPYYSGFWRRIWFSFLPEWRLPVAVRPIP